MQKVCTSSGFRPFIPEISLCNIGIGRFEKLHTFLFYRLESFSSYDLYTMNIITNLLEDYVNFAETATKQNTYFKKLIVLFVVVVSFFLFHLLCKYLNE